MTGREQRVLQGYSALRTKRTEEPSDSEPTQAGLKVDKFQLEKLCYNLDTLVDHCEHVRFHCPNYFFEFIINSISLYNRKSSKMRKNYLTIKNKYWPWSRK